MRRQEQTQAMTSLWRLALLGTMLLGAGLILWLGWPSPAKTPPPPVIPPTTAAPPAVPPAAQEARNLLDVGLKRFREHDVAGAIEAFTKAIELDPQLSLAYYARGKARTAQGDLAGALADYTKAIEVEPTSVNPYYFRGLLYVQLGEPNGALADFTQALVLDPQHAQAAFQRGLLRFQQGECDGAIADFTQTVDGDPYNAQALFPRGLCYAQHGKCAEAQADFTQVQTLDPQHNLPSCTAIASGGCHLPCRQLVWGGATPAQANPPSATPPAASDAITKEIESVTKAIEQNPQQALPYYHRGYLFTVLGKCAEAQADFMRVRELDPQHIPPARFYSRCGPSGVPSTD